MHPPAGTVNDALGPWSPWFTRHHVCARAQEWRDCPGPGPPPPGTFCSIARQWRVGDTVSLSLGMGIWMSALPDPQRVNPGLQVGV